MALGLAVMSVSCLRHERGRPIESVREGIVGFDEERQRSEDGGDERRDSEDGERGSAIGRRERPSERAANEGSEHVNGAGGTRADARRALREHGGDEDRSGDPRRRRPEHAKGERPERSGADREGPSVAGGEAARAESEEHREPDESDRGSDRPESRFAFWCVWWSRC